MSFHAIVRQMFQKGFKLLIVVCSTLCLYVLIAYSSHFPQTVFIDEYSKPQQQVYALSPDISEVFVTHDYDKCCPQLTVRSTDTAIHHQTLSSISYSNRNKLFDKLFSVNDVPPKQSINNSRKPLISNEINANRAKSVEHNTKLNCDFNIAMIFTIINTNSSKNTSNTSTNDIKNNNNNSLPIDKKLYRSLVSIGKHVNEKQRICVNLITDKLSQIHVKRIVKLVKHQNSLDLKPNIFQYKFHDISQVNKKIANLLPTLKTHFTFKQNSYYSHSLFFTSLAAHRYFTWLDKLIFLDIDVQFNDNIANLYDQFNDFSPDALIGLAYEQQPVYRHILHEYRNKIDNETSLGSPPPSGRPGFNSGVLLMNLKRLRQSKLYNRLLSHQSIDTICRKYFFSGHLGDQDFYTAISLDYQRLFHVLSCDWNRQLCQWWRYHGYRDVFDSYFKCDLKIKVFHGNCNSVMPSV